MDILSLIGNYCFPMVACIAMAWYVKYITDKQDEKTREINEKHSEEVKELNKQHSAEMLVFKDEIKEALNNNTTAITKLCEKLDKKGD